jgi:hypothetical protein
MLTSIISEPFFDFSDLKEVYPKNILREKPLTDFLIMDNIAFYLARYFEKQL